MLVISLCALYHMKHGSHHVQKMLQTLGQNGPLALIFEIFSNRTLCRKIPLFPKTPLQGPKTSLQGLKNATIGPFEPVMGTYKKILQENAAIGPKNVTIGLKNATIGPLEPVMGLIKKIFRKTPLQARKSGTLLYSSETVFLSKLFPKLMVMGHFCLTLSLYPTIPLLCEAAFNGKPRLARVPPISFGPKPALFGLNGDP